MISRVLAGKQVSDFEMKHPKKDGSRLVLSISSAPLTDGQDHITGVVVVLIDQTDRKLLEDQLREQALHDPLTGLPNRTLLFDRLRQALRSAHRVHDPFSLLLLDLDHFKEVNDTFGHHRGDMVLQDLARRLQAALRDSDTIARLGGDEFAILLPNTDEAGAVVASDTIRRALKEPFVLDGVRLSMAASIGITHYPEQGGDAHAMLRQADVAMYSAKQQHQSHAVYAPELDDHSAARLTLLDDLRRGIEDGHLVVYYQPQLSLGTGRCDRVEALVRWQDPDRGLVPPDQFIPLTERTDVMELLTQRVLCETVSQIAEWQREGLQVTVAVNLSASSLRDRELPAMIAGLLHAHRVEAQSLQLEITESAVMGDPLCAMHILTDLHHMGIRTSIDDFGTGHSSLGYLKRLPVSQIKIDRSFVMEMLADQNDHLIVRTIVDLGHNLDLEVVAEGVENQTTLESLQAMGCDRVQGYYVSRPLPAHACTEWLIARQESGYSGTAISAAP
jgi:diguanylate cyclase (GGDEF)-like protein